MTGLWAFASVVTLVVWLTTGCTRNGLWLVGVAFAVLTVVTAIRKAGAR